MKLPKHQIIIRASEIHGEQAPEIPKPNRNYQEDGDLPQNVQWDSNQYWIRKFT